MTAGLGIAAKNAPLGEGGSARTHTIVDRRLLAAEAVHGRPWHGQVNQERRRGPTVGERPAAQTPPTERGRPARKTRPTVPKFDGTAISAAATNPHTAVGLLKTWLRYIITA